MERYMWQRRTKRVSHRNVSNLCPNCFSTLNIDDSGGFACSGDRIASWRKEIEAYREMPEQAQQTYLATLSNPSKFVELVGSFDTLDCGLSNQLSNVTSTNNTRIPDPMAVGKLERILKRSLTAEELEEDYEFEFEGKRYTIPFVNFPDDI